MSSRCGFVDGAPGGTGGSSSSVSRMSFDRGPGLRGYFRWKAAMSLSALVMNRTGSVVISSGVPS